jgi:CPA2 family monovalent cation:H+ antiporter-2
VLVGYGRVGSVIGEDLRRAGRPLVVIEDRADLVNKLHAEHVEAIAGNAADPRLLAAANIGEANTLYVAIPEAFEAGQIVEQARQASPGIEILARAHSEAEAAHLTRLGANLVVMGEREIAHSMIAHTTTAGAGKEREDFSDAGDASPPGPLPQGKGEKRAAPNYSPSHTGRAEGRPEDKPCGRG